MNKAPDFAGIVLKINVGHFGKKETNNKKKRVQYGLFSYGLYYILIIKIVGTPRIA